MSITITLIIQGLAFFAVALLVMKFGWPNIMTAIETRRAKIAEGLAAADRSQHALEEAKVQALGIIREARDKAVQIVDQASRAAGATVEEARGTALTEGARLLAAARDEVASETSKVRDQLRTEVAALAVAGASQLLKREVDAKAHAALLDELANRIVAAR
jgi:F-type H+-transporting ATPase subunit b